MIDLNYRSFVSKYNDNMPLSFYNGAIEAWNYQQQKVDELIDTIKTSADSEMYLFDELQKVKGERDELQERIDMAVEHIEDYYGVVGLSMVVDILKGDQS